MVRGEQVELVRIELGLFNAPINVKPEGGGGRADHGILIVSAVPRVGILIVRDAPRVGILIVCHPHGGEI